MLNDDLVGKNIGSYNTTHVVSDDLVGKQGIVQGKQKNASISLFPLKPSCPSCVAFHLVRVAGFSLPGRP